MAAGRGLGARLAACACAAALAALCGCALVDTVPWPPLPSRSGGGRPADEVRRARAARPQGAYRPLAAEPLGDEVREGVAAFSARTGSESLALARSLDPGSQSLRSFADLTEPLRASLAHLSRQNQSAPALVQPGGQLSFGQLKATAQELLELLPRLDAEPGLLAERFVWYELAPAPLLTGYYSPEVEARLAREPGFEQPLYGVPPDLRRAAPEEERQGLPKVYRAVNGGILPYHDRRAIDLGGALSGQGLEIAWVKSPLDAFVLQTEGAGTLRLADGSRRGVQFAAGNGHAFTGLGQLLLGSGALPRERLDRQSIRAWCEADPARARELLSQNRSYVFFELRQGASVGALEKPLTALVSLATDPSLLPLGAVAALDVPLPGQNGGASSSLRGLVLAQDTGSDIRGHRLDLYLGHDARAERLEAGLRASAGLHLLVSKNALRTGANTRGQ